MTDTEQLESERQKAIIGRARECNNEADLCMFLKHEIMSIVKSRKLSVADVARKSGGTDEEMLNLLRPAHDPSVLWRLMEVLRSLGGLMMFAVAHMPVHKKGAVLWAPLSAPLAVTSEEPGPPGP